MRCEDVQAHVADHLAGALPRRTAEALAAHLQGCAGCAAELTAAEDLWRRLGVLAAPRADSAAMRARFEAALEEHQQAGVPRGRTARPAKHWALQCAAAAALVVLGIAIGRQTAPAPVPSQDAQLLEMRAELRQMREMVTLSLLQQQSASERLKGVTWTSQIDRPGREVVAALLDSLMHDPNVSVRLATVEALRRFAEHDGVRQRTLTALEQERSPLVQIALIDFVVESNGREAAEALRRLSADPMLEDAVRTRAALAAEQLG